MEYKIVDMPEVALQWGKWRKLFDTLPPNKAVLFEFKTRQEAQQQAKSIQGTLRVGRAESYRIHTRVVPADDKFQLYVWKEAK